MNFTADSRQYLNIAEQIYQNGFTSVWKNEKLVYWPPLFPVVLSISHNFGGVVFIKYLHFFLGVSLIVLWGKLSFKVVRQYNQRYIFMVLLALSTHLLMVSVFIWSELLFMVLLGIFLVCIQNYVNTMEKSWLLASIVPAFLMMVERNAGIFIYVAAIISMICFRCFSKKHIWHVVLVVGISISGFVIWNLHSIVLEDRLYMVNELVPHFTPVKNAALVLNEVGSIFYPSSLLHPFSMVLSALLIGAVFGYAFKGDQRFLKVLCLSSLLYLLVWVIIPGDKSDMGRFISVVVPMVLLAFVTVVFGDFAPIHFWKYVRRVILVLVISYSTIRIINNALLWGNYFAYRNFGEIPGSTYYTDADRFIEKPS